MQRTSSGGAPLAAAFPQRRPIAGPPVDFSLLVENESSGYAFIVLLYIYVYTHKHVYIHVYIYYIYIYIYLNI